jgi:hypothetical protein
MSVPSKSTALLMSGNASSLLQLTKTMAVRNAYLNILVMRDIMNTNIYQSSQNVLFKCAHSLILRTLRNELFVTNSS